MSTGTVGRLVRDQGFGFIKVADGIDLFFHRSEVLDVSFDLLKEGQIVDFKANLGPKGLKATNVKLLKNKAKTDVPNKDDSDVISLPGPTKPGTLLSVWHYLGRGRLPPASSGSSPALTLLAGEVERLSYRHVLYASGSRCSHLPQSSCWLHR